MTESFNMGKSSEFTFLQDQYQSQNLVLVKSDSPKHHAKITATVTHLLAIHKKIELHLKNEKPLTKFEVRKLLVILKRMDCSSSTTKKIAQSAQDILIKCIYNQVSRSEDRNLLRHTPSLTSNSSTRNENQTYFSSGDDSDSQQESIAIRPKFAENASSAHQTKSSRQHFDATASNIFPSQSQTNHANCDEGMSLSDNDNTLWANNIMPLSDVFLQRDNNTENYEVIDDKAMPLPFSVPTLLEKENNSSVSQGSNVLKLRLADVQFDSDTVSIPLELLTNLNLRSTEEQSQAASCEKFLENNVFSVNTTNEKTHNKDTSTASSDFNQFKTSAENINNRQSQNLPTITQFGPNYNQEFSSNTNDIEWADFSHASSPSRDRRSGNISCVTTTKSHRNTPIIGSFSTDIKIPILNIEMESSASNTETSNWNREVLNPQGALFMPCDDNFKTSLHSEVPYASLNRCSPGKATLDSIETNTHTENIEYAWHMPLDDLANENKNLETATPDLKFNRSITVDDDMEMCKSLTVEEGHVPITENEIRYLEMAANNPESETNDFIFDRNEKSKVISNTNVDEPEEDSFVFNLDSENTTDLVEGTPFDDTIYTKIKTHFPNKSKTQTLTENPEIISETQDIVIEETPFSSTSKAPGHYQNLTSASSLFKNGHQIQTSVCQKHSLFTPYKKSKDSKSFLDMYKSNYRRKLPKKVFESNKIKILKEIRLNYKPEKVTQSQSVPSTTEDKITKNSSNRPFTLDMADNMTLRQFSNSSLTKNCNDNKIEPDISKTQEITQSENIVLIDGTNPISNEQMDTTTLEPKEETFEEKTRKLKENIERKRNKCRETWKDKPITEKVSLKYVRKFGVNIFEDPVNSLLNINYKINVNNFHFPRLTMEQINEKLKKSTENLNILNAALTKMVDNQISSKTQEDYQFKMTRDTSYNSDSNSSDEDLPKKREKELQEIRLASRLELRKFLEDLEKERMKEETRQQEHDVEESDTEGGKSETLGDILRKAGDYSWLK